MSITSNEGNDEKALLSLIGESEDKKKQNSKGVDKAAKKQEDK